MGGAASQRTYRLQTRRRIRQGEIVLCVYCGEPIPAKSSGHIKGGISTDHKIPKALGGKSHISNYQPMHLVCNREKGSSISAPPVSNVGGTNGLQK